MVYLKNHSAAQFVILLNHHFQKVPRKLKYKIHNSEDLEKKIVIHIKVHAMLFFILDMQGKLFQNLLI